MKRQGHLFERVAEFRTLLAAAHRARRSKGNRIEVARFVFHLESNLLSLQQELRSGAYRMQPYRAFEIREPKRRRICAAHFRDRVVHHAICGVLDPIFEAGLIGDTYACRRGKGTHAAVRRLQEFSIRFPYVMCCCATCAPTSKAWTTRFSSPFAAESSRTSSSCPCWTASSIIRFLVAGRARACLSAT